MIEDKCKFSVAFPIEEEEIGPTVAIDYLAHLPLCEDCGYDLLNDEHPSFALLELVRIAADAGYKIESTECYTPTHLDEFCQGIIIDMQVCVDTAMHIHTCNDCKRHVFEDEFIYKCELSTSRQAGEMMERILARLNPDSKKH